MRAVPLGVVVVTAGDPFVLLLSGPNLNLLGEREPEIYGTDTLGDHVSVANDEAGRHGLLLEHHQSNHEGDLVDAIQGGTGPGRRHRHQCRRLHPLRLVAPRCPGCLRWTDSRVAPVQPLQPRGLAGHLGDRARRHRRRRRIRRTGLPAGDPSGRGSASGWRRLAGLSRLLRPVARKCPYHRGGRTVRTVLEGPLVRADTVRHHAVRHGGHRSPRPPTARPDRPAPSPRRLPGHQSDQHPLPHRIHRVRRDAVPVLGRGSAPHRRALRDPGCRTTGGRGRGRPGSRSPRPPTRPLGPSGSPATAGSPAWGWRRPTSAGPASSPSRPTGSPTSS